METIYVCGVGHTPFGRHLEKSVKDLTREAVSFALDDAGAEIAQIEAAYFASATTGALQGQHSIAGQIALRNMGFQRIPMFNLENACASGSSAFQLATHYIRSGEGDIALAVGVEKMYVEDKARMLAVFDSGWDVETVDRNQRTLLALGEGVEVPPGGDSDKPRSVFMDVYAAFTRQHMKKFGTTQRQIAAVSAKNHHHSVHNENSQYRQSLTVDEVMAAPPIAYPLTMPMCSPISDGAAAVIVCNDSGLRKLKGDRGRAVKVLATVTQTGSDRDPGDHDNHLTAHAARKLYEKAGVGPESVDVAEVHDATAMGEIIQVENLGLVPFGEAGLAAERGELSIGGRIPVNPSGGLESRGHPVGATGLAQIHELVSQLRGEAGARQVEGARIAVQENGGGLYGYEEAVAVLSMFSTN
jgi:acetyl-CoA acetyltransferase